nr:hypothetical protein [Brevibacillus laterosporus]
MRTTAMVKIMVYLATRKMYSIQLSSWVANPPEKRWISRFSGTNRIMMAKPTRKPYFALLTNLFSISEPPSPIFSTVTRRNMQKRSFFVEFEVEARVLGRYDGMDIVIDAVPDA